MKRLSTILLGALAIMMAGCSKDIEPSSSNPDAWKTDITLPVPVEFGTPFVTTKADYINNMQDGMRFGVFGVNAAATDLNNADDKLLDNFLAFYTAEKGFHLNSPRYYPMTNEKNYNFYAYYRAQGDPGRWFVDNNKIYVAVEIGREDVLYGSTKVTPHMESVVGRGGFNGGYIRAVRSLQEANPGTDYSGYTPSINFKHTTAAIQFYVKTASASSAEVFAAQGFKVAEIALTNRPVKANLCVVDTESDIKVGSEIVNANEGKFAVPADANYYGSQKVYLNDNESSSKLNLAPQFYTGVVPALGQPIFIVPTAENEKIEGYIKLVYNDNSLFSNIPLTIDPEKIEYNGQKITSFKAGHRYNITLVIHSPEAITIEVDVEKWKDGFTGEDYDDATAGGFEYELG